MFNAKEKRRPRLAQGEERGTLASAKPPNVGRNENANAIALMKRQGNRVNVAEAGLSPRVMTRHCSDRRKKSWVAGPKPTAVWHGEKPSPDCPA
jgi:hypothetical protein